jgi:hypothetical protein
MNGNDFLVDTTHLELPLVTADADFKKIKDINLIHLNLHS